jgi:hypothetical protein
LWNFKIRSATVSPLISADSPTQQLRLTGFFKASATNLQQFYHHDARFFQTLSFFLKTAS